MRHFRLRVLNAEQQPLQVRDLGKLGKPETRSQRGWIERTWEARNIAALPHEDSQPNWHFMYPRIEFTEFADWDAVRAWAEPLYTVHRSDDAQLRALMSPLSRLNGRVPGTDRGHYRRDRGTAR